MSAEDVMRLKGKAAADFVVALKGPCYIATYMNPNRKFAELVGQVLVLRPQTGA
jgi:hypothetical protein